MRANSEVNASAPRRKQSLWYLVEMRYEVVLIHYCPWQKNFRNCYETSIDLDFCDCAGRLEA